MNESNATATSTKSAPARKRAPAKSAAKRAPVKATKKVASKTTSKRSTASSDRGTKMDQARAIYAKNKKADRSVLVQKLIEGIRPKISPAGASTYASLLRAN